MKILFEVAHFFELVPCFSDHTLTCFNENGIEITVTSLKWQLCALIYHGNYTEYAEEDLEFGFKEKTLRWSSNEINQTVNVL